MAVITSISDLIDDALGATDREVDEFDSGWLKRVAERAVRDLWTTCVRLNRDEYTKTSPSFTIPTGNTHVIGTGATASAADFLSLRSLEYDIGGGIFRPLRPYRFRDRATPGRLSYRIFAKTIDIQPAEQAAAWTFRARYLYQPVFGNTDAPIDLPMGGDDVCGEEIAAKIRGRFEESPDAHLTAKILAMQTVVRFLTDHDQGPPEPIPEAGDFLDDDGVTW
jgi:hypothetical protein